MDRVPDGVRSMRWFRVLICFTVCCFASNASPQIFLAAQTTVPLVANTRLGLTSVYDSTNTTADIAALLASSSAKTKPSITIGASASRTIAYKVATHPNGAILNYQAIDSTTLTFALAYSDDSTDGSDGSWTGVTTLNYAPAIADSVRGAAEPFPNHSGAGRWLRIVATNAGSSTTVRLGVYLKPASGLMDLVVAIGMSITIQDLAPFQFESYIVSLDSRRDPIFINMGVFGYKTTDMTATTIPLLSTAIAGGAPFAAAYVDVGPNDIASTRPYATDPSPNALATNSDLLRAAIVTAGVPEARQFWADMDFVNFQTAPNVNNIAGAPNGTTPYNQNTFVPWLRTKSFPATVSTALDSSLLQHSVMTTTWFEDEFIDGPSPGNGSGNGTHPTAAFVPEAWRRWKPAIRYLSGLSIGPSYLEELITQTQTIGTTTSFNKTRLADLMSLLPATVSSPATTYRVSLNTIISGLGTTYADPGGVVLPSARSVPLTLWMDGANQAQMTLTNSRISAIADRSSNAFTFSQATATLQPFYLANHTNGRNTIRSRTNASRLTGNEAGLQTLFDAQADFSIEIYERSWALGTGGCFAGWSNIFFDRTTAGGPLRMFIDSGHTITSSATPALGVPSYWAITYNATTHVFTMYFNGTSTGTLAFTKPLWTSTAMVLMARSNNASPSADDLLELVAYSGVLSAGDITNGHTYGQVKWNTP